MSYRGGHAYTQISYIYTTYLDAPVYIWGVQVRYGVSYREGCAKGVRLITNMSRRARVKTNTKTKTKAHQRNGGNPRKRNGPMQGGAKQNGSSAKADAAKGTGGGGGAAGGGGGKGAQNIYKRDKPRSINDALIDSFLGERASVFIRSDTHCICIHMCGAAYRARVAR